MYYQPDNHLDTPPPPSQFRRPWSPDPYDPLPSTSPLNHEPYDPQLFPRHPQLQQRREASDASVEALDLADYARTLRQSRNPYPTFPAQQEQQYPSSPRSTHPLTSRGSLSPPSLVSDGPTASSSRSRNAYTSRSHRAFSLPPPAPAYRPTSPLSRSQERPSIVQHQENLHIRPNDEIDVSQFPRWSRNWYSNRPNQPLGTSQDGHSLPSDHHGSKHASPFDPGYHQDLFNPYASYPYSPPSTESHRDTLPWSTDPPEYGPPLNAEVKGERIRMLEREFGSKVRGKGKASEYVDEDGKPVIGSVDEKGRLVTQGPKKRFALRFLQVVLTLGAGIPPIYVALIIKPKAKPPPSGSLAAFALYTTSVLTFLLLTYLFLIRPCCTGRRLKSDSNGLMSGFPGMMVLPVGIPGTGKKGKKPKKGKKGNGNVGGGDVQVNLIMDPGLLGGDSHQDHHSDGHSDPDDDDYDNYTIPGSYSHRRPRRKVKPRRSIFAGLAQESAWRDARRSLKWMTWIDAGCMALWGALFVLILVGKRCPAGAFDGWCTGYNVGSASACLLCVAFGVNIFFDVKDLHSSRVSPRTRG